MAKCQQPSNKHGENAGGRKIILQPTQERLNKANIIKEC